MTRQFIKLLRIEGLAEAVLAMAAFAATGESWWTFALLILLPDVSMLAYFAGPRAGAIAYNIAHSLVGPAAVATAGLSMGWTVLLPLAAIWFAHIGIDRALGYGLKSTAAFKSTHLGEIGRPSAT